MLAKRGRGETRQELGNTNVQLDLEHSVAKFVTVLKAPSCWLQLYSSCLSGLKP
jgi:hypothetical protein